MALPSQVRILVPPLTSGASVYPGSSMEAAAHVNELRRTVASVQEAAGMPRELGIIRVSRAPAPD